MAAYERVRVELGGGIAQVTLDRPEKLNAFDRSMCEDLEAALGMLARTDGVRVIVVTGAGRAFSAGADLAVLGVDGPALVAAGKAIALAIRGAPQPVLAAVNGPAAGGGANLALACDYRIASDQASIGQVFHKLGLVPDWGGTFFLPRLAGTSKALELVWSARMVPAAEALELGLFDRVVPHARLAAEARALAEAWAAQPPEAVRRAKRALYESAERTLAAALENEIAQQEELFATPDVRARIAGGASLPKRSARWSAS
ncbi:MAG TPA: enoyl-CoA hydratase/isomerase family protein [Candidatus Dormibacteraeota bacterium]|nr:enoyl-CoA hydratase/isomerase family protein [Candidatus Dormibacteraeota bacterium]